MKNAVYDTKRKQVTITRDNGMLLNISFNLDKSVYQWSTFNPTSNHRRYGSGDLKKLIVSQDIENEEYLFFNQYV